MSEAYPIGDGGLVLPHPLGYVASHYITFVKGSGMRVRIVNVPGSTEEGFVQETADYLCPCGPPSIYHFTAVDGGNVVNYITMDSHEALHFMTNPDELFQNPQTITMRDEGGDEHDLGLMGILTTADEPLIPEGELLDSVIAECIDFLTDQGADTDDFNPDRVRAADVYGSTEAMFEDFKNMLEGEVSGE